MRRRRPLNVWPAFADLMTVLAVVGLFSAIEMRQQRVEVESGGSECEELRLQVAQLKDELQATKDELQATKDELERVRKQLQAATVKVGVLTGQNVRNQEMLNAINEVASLIDNLPPGTRELFESDQSLRFGDDLVSFDLNGTDPQWEPAGEATLSNFCEQVLGHLAADSERFEVHVEGHSDSSGCLTDPHCNWAISSQRALEFAKEMRDPKLCPGGADWQLRPIGFADEKPEVVDGKSLPPSRRISVRLVPNYQELLRGGRRAEGGM